MKPAHTHITVNPYKQKTTTTARTCAFHFISFHFFFIIILVVSILFFFYRKLSSSLLAARSIIIIVISVSWWKAPDNRVFFYIQCMCIFFGYSNIFFSLTSFNCHHSYEHKHTQRKTQTCKETRKTFFLSYFHLELFFLVGLYNIYFFYCLFCFCFLSFVPYAFMILEIQCMHTSCPHLVVDLPVFQEYISHTHIYIHTESLKNFFFRLVPK